MNCYAPVDTRDLSLTSREEIISICQSPRRHCICDNGKAKIIRAGKAAIKFGRISIEEIENQARAQTLLDPTIVRVPRIWFHFKSDGVTYVVMDYIEGEQKQSIQDDTTVNAVARVVNHLHTFCSTTPGPVNGGHCSGPLWSEDESIAFEKVHDLESYVRSRLRRQTDIFTLATTPLVLTHGDIAPRNLIFTATDIWLLDWEFAGYFPRSAEIAALRLGSGKCVNDLPFYLSLDAAILRERPLGEFELQQVKCWQELAVNHVRFYWPTEEEKGWMYKPRRGLNGKINRRGMKMGALSQNE